MKRGARLGLGVAALLLVALVGGFLWFVRHPLAALEAAERRALRRAGFEVLRIGEGNEALTVLVAGEGPPLVFLHGLGDQAGSWAKVAPAFTGSHRVWLPDLPGHGESAPRAGELTMATVLDGAERIVAHATDGERPAILVGNSLGAWLATLVAHRHPERVARLVLVDGGALAGEPGGPSLTPKNRREAAALMALLRDPSAPPLPGFVLDDVVRRAASGPIARLSADLPGLVAHLLEGRLGEVTTPTDLLWGASDRLVPLAYAERVRGALPAARLTRIEQCGHVPQVECPERFAAELAKILAAPPPEPAP